MQTSEEIYAERIAHIQSSPLLVALSQITNLGTCGGKGGFQKALDIAVSAIEADYKRVRETTFKLDEEEAEDYSLTCDAENAEGLVIGQSTIFRWRDTIVAVGELNYPNQWDDKKFERICADLERALFDARIDGEQA